MGLQRRLSNERLNGKKTWGNAFNKRKGKEEAEEGKSLENSVFCRLTLYETVLGGLPIRVRRSCCCCPFFVTMLQVLFTKPQYLTRVQEFVNVRLNCRTECYLPNWVQVISFPKKLCTTKRVERKNPSSAMNMLKATKIIHRDILAKWQRSVERLKGIVNNMRFQNRCEDFRRTKIHSWLVTCMKRKLLFPYPS